MPITPGIIQTVLGNGQEGWGGDGGPASQAACETPYMCAFDTQGHLFVCMGQHHRIRRMDAAGNLYIADTHNHRVRVVGLYNS